MLPRLRRAPTAPSTTGYWLDNDTAIFWLFTVMIIIACERLLIHGGYNLWNDIFQVSVFVAENFSVFYVYANGDGLCQRDRREQAQHQRAKTAR